MWNPDLIVDVGDHVIGGIEEDTDDVLIEVRAGNNTKIRIVKEYGPTDSGNVVVWWDGALGWTLLEENPEHLIDDES
jgi:hypothetical protein